MTVRPAIPADREAWLQMREALWPESRHDHEREIAAHFDEPPDSAECFVAEVPEGGLVGFAEVGLRGYAEGEPSGSFHRALGFEEVERIVCFRKSLGEAEEAA